MLLVACLHMHEGSCMWKIFVLLAKMKNGKWMEKTWKMQTIKSFFFCSIKAEDKRLKNGYLLEKEKQKAKWK